MTVFSPFVHGYKCSELCKKAFFYLLWRTLMARILREAGCIGHCWLIGNSPENFSVSIVYFLPFSLISPIDVPLISHWCPISMGEEWEMIGIWGRWNREMKVIFPPCVYVLLTFRLYIAYVSLVFGLYIDYILSMSCVGVSQNPHISHWCPFVLPFISHWCPILMGEIWEKWGTREGHRRGYCRRSFVGFP